MGRQGRIPELDGLRGIAILMVLFSHYCSNLVQGVTFFPLGLMGVQIFFVLSGFLIGGIILDEHRTSGFLTSFYLRRIARIAPVYFTVIALAFLAHAAAVEQLWMEGDKLLPAWMYISFTSNFGITLAHNWSAGLMLVPTWSLAVEEQFYLAAPLLIMLTPRRWLPCYLTAILMTAVIMRFAWRSNYIATEIMLPCVMDSLAIGIGVALIHRAFDLAAKATLCTLIGALLMLGIIIIENFSRYLGTLLFPTVFDMAVALVMLAAINGAAFGKFLRGSTLRFFGKISYGLYLINQPVLILFTGVFLGTSINATGLSHVQISLASCITSVALAILSWRYFEKPIIDRAKTWIVQNKMLRFRLT